MSQQRIGERTLKVRLSVVEKEHEVCRLTHKIFFDLSGRGSACVARIQDRDRSTAGYVPVDPAMHGHHSNIHLLLAARRKERVDDSVRRHFARSDEEESRWALFQKQFFQRRQLAENCLSNFRRQLARKTFEPLGYLKKSCLVHVFAKLQR